MWTILFCKEGQSLWSFLQRFSFRLTKQDARTSVQASKTLPFALSLQTQFLWRMVSSPQISRMTKVHLPSKSLESWTQDPSKPLAVFQSILMTPRGTWLSSSLTRWRFTCPRWTRSSKPSFNLLFPLWDSLPLTSSLSGQAQASLMVTLSVSLFQTTSAARQSWTPSSPALLPQEPLEAFLARATAPSKSLWPSHSPLNRLHQPSNSTSITSTIHPLPSRLLCSKRKSKTRVVLS